MRVKQWVVAGLCSLLLACQHTPMPQEYPKPDFTNQPALHFNAHSLEIQENYRSTNRAPNVEHLFPNPPLEMLRRWAKQRLRFSDKSENHLVLVIDEASVVESKLPKQHIGWKDGFYVEPAKGYNGKIRATLKLYTPDSRLPKAEVSASSFTKETTQENASPEEIKRIYNNMMLALIHRFNLQMDQQIEAYMKAYKVTKP